MKRMKLMVELKLVIFQLQVINKQKNKSQMVGRRKFKHKVFSHNTQMEKT